MLTAWTSLFEAPSNMILVRTRPSLFLPVVMAIWGALTICMAAVKHYHHLLALRLLVGVFEAAFAPGILMIISSWYKKNEQSRRFAVYLSAAILSGAFGGLLAGAITGGMEGSGGLRGWRWLFIIEGVCLVETLEGETILTNHRPRPSSGRSVPASSSSTFPTIQRDLRTEKER